MRQHGLRRRLPDCLWTGVQGRRLMIHRIRRAGTSQQGRGAGPQRGTPAPRAAVNARTFRSQQRAPGDPAVIAPRPRALGVHCTAATARICRRRPGRTNLLRSQIISPINTTRICCRSFATAVRAPWEPCPVFACPRPTSRDCRNTSTAVLGQAGRQGRRPSETRRSN